MTAGVPATTIIPIALFDDNPALEDLLGFDAVVSPVVEALKHPGLDPITIGVHAPWGGGKSTVLNLVAAGAPKDWIVVRSTPWEYEDQLDVKGTLIAEVLTEIQARVKDKEGFAAKFESLFRRISWSRVGLVVAKGALTMQWDPEKLIDAFMPVQEDGPRSLAAFRKEFGELVATLPDTTRVVVLVDDLDRCLPDAVMATLEAIKLFLSVKGMAFVIAADQDMVRDAIAASLTATGRSEAFAERYLEKIVQLPVSMPRLSPVESEAYIGLLLTQAISGPDSVQDLVAHCANRRQKNLAPLLDDLDGLTVRPTEETLKLAKQLNDGMSPAQRSNPREIKRRLNAFGVRSQVASARGLEVRPDVVLKMLLLEDRWRRAFEKLVARPPGDRGEMLAAWEAWGGSDASDLPEGITGEMREWAASDPQLAGLDLDAYITLAGTLSAASLGTGMSDDLRRLVRQLLSETDAVRETAEVAVGERSEEDRRKIGAALLDDSRRSDPGKTTLIVRGLITVAKASPNQAADLARGVKDRMWANLSPGIGVELGSSEVEEFVALARQATEDPTVPETVKVAIRPYVEAG
jgi:hypothetical protein